MNQLINEVHHAIDETSISRLVREFYNRARQDDEIGEIFNSNVEDWEHHLQTITDFWSSIILKTGRYDGRPLPPHLRLGLQEKHFDRWLQLFEKTAREIWPDEAADIFIYRAKRIADSFEMGIATQAGEYKSPRHSRRV
ncbi:group III truncated hemoglobin [Brucellaceae bacterium C25G]